jgi:hypothetical protein
MQKIFIPFNKNVIGGKGYGKPKGSHQKSDRATSKTGRHPM